MELALFSETFHFSFSWLIDPSLLFMVLLEREHYLFGFGHFGVYLG